MTAQEAAATLNGNEYAREGSKDLFAAMREAGLVAVFGASDDLTEFRGAINDEASAYGGAEHYLTRAGLLESECRQGDTCPYFEKLLGAMEPAIHAQWDQGGYSWLISTDLPHATFDIVEDGEPYCRGVVIAVADLPA